MAGTMGPAQPRDDASLPEVAADENDLRQSVLSNLIRACDLVFGTTMAILGLLGIWLVMVGKAQAMTVAVFWALPAVNIVYTALTRHRDRTAADLIRCAVCLPLTIYLYTAESGVFERMWIPTILMCMGAAMMLSLGSRHSQLGYLVTVAYAGAILVASNVTHGGIDVAALVDALGIALTGCMASIICSNLGRTLAELARERDIARAQTTRAEGVLDQLTQRSEELTAALENLHTEMAHRMRVEVELRQAQKLESIGRLAAGVAHEINTPAQFVSDSVQFVRNVMTELFDVVDKLEVVQRSVLDGAPSRDAAIAAADAADTADLPYLVENVPKALERALEGLSRVTAIVRSMKELAHPGTKEMAAFDLNRAIESTLRVARHEYLYVAELETEFGELPLVQCHVGELSQVVLNIIVNAAHAIGDVVQGTGTKGRIGVRTYREGDDVIIAISDTGGGIPVDARDRIFDPFFTTKQVGRGTGQGLAIAHSVVVDKHHGRLAFETELGKGTTFLIRLPIDGQRATRADAA